MKTIAMYLPQFHRTPENDEWWGEGFTDWVAVKNAKSLYAGHHQPRVPLDEKYYDLLQKDVMQWQASLMKKYGIDGVCMYHYWFKDGRRILEKPMENLLKWTDIDMPFCICWANETWARSWSDIGNKNTWMISENKNRDAEGNGVLLQQDYGKCQQWEEHFNYFLPFFWDDRYIRIDGRPVILLYRASEIYCLGEMLECWSKLAKKNGLGSLYVIGGNTDAVSSGLLDGCLYHEPQRALRKIKELNPMDSSDGMSFSYDDVWKELLRTQPDNDVQPFFEGFVGYDDSPRRGRNGMIVDGGTPEKFEKYLRRLFKKNNDYGSEIVFINAWNEWGESMYLEPDQENGYTYLDAVKKAKESWENEEYADTVDVDYIKSLRAFSDRVNGNLIVMSKWMYLLEKGVLLSDYISERIGNRVAIYGWGVLGEHLYRQIKDKIDVSFIIDRNIAKIECDEILYLPTDDYSVEDALIVTSVYYFTEIEEQMRGKGFNCIYSLSNIVDACMNAI